MRIFFLLWLETCLVNVGIRMEKSNRLMMLKRRKDMLLANRNGEKSKDFVKRIAKKYDVSEDSLLRDWNRRKKWQKEVLLIEDIESFVTEWLLDEEMIYLEAWNLYHEEKNSYKKYQKLIFISKLRSMKAKNLKDMGIFDLIKAFYENKAKEEQLKKIKKEEKKKKPLTEEEIPKDLADIVRQAQEEDIIAIYNGPKIEDRDKNW